MHELSVATSMIDEIERALAAEGAPELLAVHVRLGAMSGVERGPLEFCFPLAAEGTSVEGARLVVTEEPLTLRCRRCDAVESPDIPMALCPACGATEVDITGGRELTITSLEVR